MMLERLQWVLGCSQLLLVRLLDASIYINFLHIPQYSHVANFTTEGYRRLIEMRCLTDDEARLIRSCKIGRAAKLSKKENA